MLLIMCCYTIMLDGLGREEPMTRSPRFCAIYMMGESWLKSFEILKVHSKGKQSKVEKINKGEIVHRVVVVYKRGTYTALSHFNFEFRHGAHERSTLDLFGGASAAAAGPGLSSIASIVKWREINKSQ